MKTAIAIFAVVGLTWYAIIRTFIDHRRVERELEQQRRAAQQWARRGGE